MVIPRADEAARAVLAQVDPEETVELARSLVRIPSVSGREGRAIGEFMHGWLRAADLDAGLQDVAPGRANVYARLSGASGGPCLLLNGHLDTKPFDNMTVDPTSGEVREGRLYGRGACDMKAAVAGCMVAMKAVARSGVPLRGTLLFGSEVGEEGGGWRLADLLDGPCACDLMICGEPTELEVHVGNRGWFRIGVRTVGRATHSGTAYRGVNAVEKMAKVVLALYEMPCFHREDPLWGRSPINAQEIRAGGKVTASVPDDCEAIFDVRLNPDLPPAELERDLEATLARLRREDPQLAVEWRFRDSASSDFYPSSPAVYLPPDHGFVRLVAGAAEAVLGRPVRLGGFPGGCAAGVCLGRGIPSVVFGPGSLAQAHSADEWIEVAQIAQAARVYAVAAVRALADV